MSNANYRVEPVTSSVGRAPAFPLDPAPSLTALRVEQPIARLAVPEGATGVWMITGYDLVRQVLADPRFSSRSETHFAELGTYPRELALAKRALLHRFPTLRLAAPAEELSFHTDPSQVHGMHSLLVTWDRG